MFPPRSAAWLLLALFSNLSSAQTFPSIAEVDLLFPRNDTYAPTVLMPMVFAIQSYPAAAPLNISLDWILYYPADAEVITIIRRGIIPRPVSPASLNGTFYEYTSLYNLTTLEGKWKLNWTLTTENCTMFPANNSIPFGYHQINSVIFTTANGAQAADLVVATADDVCASAESFTFNITSEAKVSQGSGTAVTTCAVVASMSPTPTPNPCAAQLDANKASSISSVLTTNACSLPSSLVSCPAKSAGSMGAQLGGLKWVALFLYSIWMASSM